MNHHTTADFWDCYARLPESVRRVADRHYALLRENPNCHAVIHLGSECRSIEQVRQLRQNQPPHLGAPA